MRSPTDGRPAARVAAALACVLLWTGVVAPGARASARRSSTFEVDSVADASDAARGDGACADASGACTLRAAVEEANALTGTAVTVEVPAGTYVLSLGTLDVAGGRLAVAGAGADSTTIRGSGTARVVRVDAPAEATVSGVTITGGDAGPSGYGGGLLSFGSLALRDTRVVSNVAVAGGGVANDGGTLVVISSLVARNRATAYGGGGVQNGGPDNAAGSVRIVRSAILGNVASGDGGGILNGQNGHPRIGGRSALAVRPYCGWLAPCRGTPRRTHAGIGPLPLDLVVAATRIEANRSGNAGGGVANDGGVATIAATSIDGNSAGGAIGGGISMYGTLSLARSTVRSNTAAYGGGIEAFTGSAGSTASVRTTTISGNSALIGGGVDDSLATFRIVGSTLSANTATTGGGAVEVEGGAAVTVIDATITGNVAPTGRGGGVETYACGSAVLGYDTFGENSSALDLSCADAVVTGTILVSSTTGRDCVGDQPTETTGHNLDADGSCRFDLATDLAGVDPILGALANTGGPTATEAVSADSPAVDHGGSAADGCPAADQRGAPRPSGAACDIGAFELQV